MPKLHPLEDRIVVRPGESEETTASGLVIPDTAKEKPQQGEVLAVGPDAVEKTPESSSPSTSRSATPSSTPSTEEPRSPWRAKTFSFSPAGTYWPSWPSCLDDIAELAVSSAGRRCVTPFTEVKGLERSSLQSCPRF